MSNQRIKLSLILNYFVFAILLNSVGTVILQVQNNYGITASQASILEAFKDLSIAAASFVVASYLTRIGYKRSMMLSLVLVSVACLAMPQLPSFWMTKLLFAVTGVSFALIKVSVFATIGLITDDQKDHVSFMNFLESFFMIGVLSGYFLFSSFIDDNHPESRAWLNVYYMLAGITLVALLLLLSTPIDESGVTHEAGKSLTDDLSDMLKLAVRPLVMVFVMSAFVYVLLEQGIMSWLPTFNSRILHLPTSLSIQMASILAASTAFGRFLAGIILRRMPWFTLLSVCLIVAAGLVLVALPLAASAHQSDGTAITGWSTAPLAAFVFPLIGLFLAPIYPAINSVILSNLPVRQHGPMSGLIVVFSALGGTTGSILVGHVFDAYGGQTAFYFSLLPLAGLLVILFLFNRMQPARTTPLEPVSAMH